MSTKFAWVIEAPGPSYLAVWSRQFYWSANHANALRFSDAKQADNVLMAVRELKPDLFPSVYAHFPKAVEHGWLSGDAEPGVEGGT